MGQARQLDFVPATISALEEVVQAADGKMPVFLDGGLRRGTDVLKALAFCATAIFVSSLSFFSVLYSFVLVADSIFLAKPSTLFRRLASLVRALRGTHLYPFNL
jgi:hypothetical protein